MNYGPLELEKRIVGKTSDQDTLRLEDLKLTCRTPNLAMGFIFHALATKKDRKRLDTKTSRKPDPKRMTRIIKAYDIWKAFAENKACVVIATGKEARELYAYAREHDLISDTIHTEPFDSIDQRRSFFITDQNKGLPKIIAKTETCDIMISTYANMSISTYCYNYRLSETDDYGINDYHVLGHVLGIMARDLFHAHILFELSKYDTNHANALIDHVRSPLMTSLVLHMLLIEELDKDHLEKARVAHIAETIANAFDRFTASATLESTYVLLHDRLEERKT